MTWLSVILRHGRGICPFGDRNGFRPSPALRSQRFFGCGESLPAAVAAKNPRVTTSLGQGDLQDTAQNFKAQRLEKITAQRWEMCSK